MSTMNYFEILNSELNGTPVHSARGVAWEHCAGPHLGVWRFEEITYRNPFTKFDASEAPQYRGRRHAQSKYYE